MTMNNLYALLIGIDCYLQNRLSDGSYYKSLGRCVRDINHVESYFVNNLKVPETNIFKLTASNVEGSDKPKESLEQLPTYKNMVAKFKEVADTAQKGNLVYIHYSGHGGRAKTHFPKLKGNLGVDETLVRRKCQVTSKKPTLDGKMLASGSSDYTVKLWKRDSDYLLNSGCNFLHAYYKTNPPENETDKHLCDR